jgi:hypothetical protein
VDLAVSRPRNPSDVCPARPEVLNLLLSPQPYDGISDEGGPLFARVTGSTAPGRTCRKAP